MRSARDQALNLRLSMSWARAQPRTRTARRDRRQRELERERIVQRYTLFSTDVQRAEGLWVGQLAHSLCGPAAAGESRALRAKDLARSNDASPRDAHAAGAVVRRVTLRARPTSTSTADGVAVPLARRDQRKFRCTG